MQKLPNELLEKIFQYIQSERDAEQFYIGVFLDGEDTDWNHNTFIREAERRRWSKGDVALVSSLPYNNRYIYEIGRISGVVYDFSLMECDELPQMIYRMYEETTEAFHNLTRTMRRLRRYYRDHDQHNTWIWKLEAKRRYEKAAQFLNAMTNMLEMNSELEEWLSDHEDSVVKETYQQYKTRYELTDDVWWVTED